MPSDGPYFPAPEKRPSTSVAVPYRKSAEMPAPPPTPATSATIVQRAEPPREESDSAARGAAPTRFTREEVRALLAVDGAQRPRWHSSARRGFILLPVGLLSRLLHLVLGDYAFIAVALFTVAAFVWIARPLFRKDDFV